MGNKKLFYTGLITFFIFFASLAITRVNAFGSSTTTDEVTITIPESCSLSGSVGTAHTAEIENGVYSDDIGETTISATCNDSEGFAIYAVGFTNDTPGNNILKPSTVSLSYAIATGTATSGDTSNWAMKLTSLSDNFTLANSFGSYHAVPNSYTKVASYPSNTTTTAGVQVKSTYAGFISISQPADSYSGKVKYIIVHPSNADAPTTGISDLTYLQDFNTLTAEQQTTVKSSMSYDTTYNLLDNRDNQIYSIAKLRDNNIWMIDNLNLGGVSLSTNLTSNNTNTYNTVPAGLFNSWRKTSNPSSYSETYYTGVYIPIDNGLESTSQARYGTAYNYFVASAGTYYGDDNRTDATHDICPAGWRMPTGNVNSSDTSSEFYALANNSAYNTSEKIHASVTNGGAAFPLAGYLSNDGIIGKDSDRRYWTSTSRRATTMMNTADSSNLSTNSGMDRHKGGTIRCILKTTATVSLSFDAGVSSVIIDDVVVTNSGPIQMEIGKTHSIGVNFDSSHGMGSWSTSAGVINSPNSRYTTFIPTSMASNLNVTTTNVTPTAIQNLNSADCTSEIKYVYDNRDNQVYAIKRLDDGNCWMLNNLNLGEKTLTTDLTSANTNLSNTISASTFNSWIKALSQWEQTYDNGSLYPIGLNDYEAGTNYGTLYNYYAASAGTISGSSNGNNASYDICPAGWRLPTGGSSGEIETLYENNSYNTVAKMQTPAEQNGAAFSSPGIISETHFYDKNMRGNYWTSKVTDNHSMNTVFIYGVNSYYTSGVYPEGSYSRSSHDSIRCIMKKPTHTLTVSYGTGISAIRVDGTTISNGSSINLEEGVGHSIEADVTSGYGFDTWSTTSGTLSSTSTSQTLFTIGTDNATISASASYVSTVLQNLSSSSCTTTSIKARDSRDNHVYTVKRLADGKCWMVENLDLGRTALTTDLTSSNTNLSSTITASTFNGWKKTSSSSTTYNGEFINVSGSDPLSNSPYGTNYNYYVASAGTITGSSNSGDATYDICPAGWRLPTGGGSSEYATLLQNYSTFEALSTPIANNGFGLARASYSGTYAYLWSSTNISSSYSSMYTLAASENDLSVYGYTSRGNCCSIRCVLK